MPNKQPSSSETSIIYRPCLTTFIDLLGFKQIVETRSANEIAKLLKIARRHVRDEQDIEELYEGAFFAFSDSLIRIQPVDTEFNKEEPLGLLFREILQMVHAQSKLAERGIFIRGAMTFGDMYHDQETAFGPGLIKAYQFETHTALYPRLIIDPNLLQSLDKTPPSDKSYHAEQEEKHYIKKLLRLDADGFWHIDYLHAMCGEEDDFKRYLKFLKKHKEHVEKASLTESASVYAKMAWLAHYHNEIIRKLGKKALEAEGSSLLQHGPRLPQPVRETLAAIARDDLPAAGSARRVVRHVVEVSHADALHAGYNDDGTKRAAATLVIPGESFVPAGDRRFA